MNVYPPELKQAAKSLLNSSDFATLFRYRTEELKEDVINSVEQSEIMDAHRELSDLKLFGEWIAHIAEETLKRRPKVHEE